MTELPKNNNVRWVMSRKRNLVSAIKEGKISRKEAMERYCLSQQELDIWDKFMVSQVSSN